MDRTLPAHVRRHAQIARLVRIGALLAIVAAVVAWLPSWLRPSVSLSRVRMAVVTEGGIDATITASGIVMPAVERVISSPLDARILRVLKRPGAAVRRGDAVIELDTSESVAALQRAENDVRVKENQQRQTRLGYEKALADLDGRLQIKELELETRRTTLDGSRQLAARGLLSKEELRRSELARRQAEIELELLEGERANAARATSLQLDGISLEQASLDRDISEKRKVLDLATTKSDRDGILTWVVSEEGSLVRRGDLIARIADLSSFRVDATASDVHASRIRTGLPAHVRLDDVTLDGQVTDVFPAVQNGTVRFTVALSTSDHPRLRPSLRADVEIVTERRARALKVRRGPFLDDTGAGHVFVLRAGRAYRTPVELGVASFDEVEVRSGLSAGDTVIISDMRDYLHLAEVGVR